MVRKSQVPSCLQLMIHICCLTFQFLTTLRPCLGETTTDNISPGEEVQTDNIFLKDGWYSSSDSYNSYDRNGGGERGIGSVLLLLPPVLGLLYCLFCGCDQCLSSGKDSSRETVDEEAKKKVEMDIAKNTNNNSSRYMPPSECTYKASYTSSNVDGSNEIICKIITLKFSKISTNDDNFDVERNVASTNGNGWNITGSGSIRNGKLISIPEGKLCAATGQAYWIEISRGAPIVNMGKFETPHFESFVGSWGRVGYNGWERYHTFRKCKTRGARRSQGSSSSRSHGGRVVRSELRHSGEVPTYEASLQSPSITYGEA